MFILFAVIICIIIIFLIWMIRTLYLAFIKKNERLKMIIVKSLADAFIIIMCLQAIQLVFTAYQRWWNNITNGVYPVIDPLFFSVLIFGLVLSINVFRDKRGKIDIAGASFLTVKNRKTFTIIISCIILTIFSVVNALINVTHPIVSRQLMLPMQNVTVIRDNSDLIYELPTEPIMLMIQSRSADYISSDSLRAELDLSGLSSGTHDVELRFDLPRNISVRNSPVILRVVINQ